MDCTFCKVVGQKLIFGYGSSLYTKLVVKLEKLLAVYKYLLQQESKNSIQENSGVPSSPRDPRGISRGLHNDFSQFSSGWSCVLLPASCFPPRSCSCGHPPSSQRLQHTPPSPWSWQLHVIPKISTEGKGRAERALLLLNRTGLETEHMLLLTFHYP